MTAPQPPESRRTNIPAHVDQDALLKAMPWLADWLRPPNEQALAHAAPRDFIRTPYALAMLDCRPQDAQFLDGSHTPWESLQRIARRLLERHTSWIGQYAPLHRFIILAQESSCLAAAQSADATLNQVGPHGHTALTLAALLGHNAIVDILIAHGADVHAVDVLGNTALHWACIMRNQPLCARLRELGARPDQRNVLDGYAADYDAAWNHLPPTQLSMDIEFRDGSTQHITDQETFTKLLHFEFLPRARPGIDCYAQLILGMLQPPWVQNVHQSIGEVGTFEQRSFVELPLFLKEFPEPFGWGVCTRETIAQGTPVTSYVGDLVHSFEVTVDLFNCGFTLYTSNAQPNKKMQQLFLSHFDARRSGNLGSRINSSHVQEAASLDNVYRFCKGLPTSIFFAARDIQAGEQISWFYGTGYWEARGIAAQPLPTF